MLALTLLATAYAGTARFDTIPEGATRRSLTEDGVTISGFDNRVDPPPGVLTAEDASDTLAGTPGFSSPGVLGFGGYVPGPGAAFGQFGALDITGPVPADSASVEVFEFGNDGVSITLRAWLGGRVVASDTATLGGGWAAPAHHTLAIEGVTFDRLRLEVGDGAVAYIGLDDVRVGSREDPVDTDVDTATADTAAPDTAVDTGAAPVVEDKGDTDRPVDDRTDLPDDPADAAVPEGCGCAQGPASPLAGATLLVAALARRRRRTC